MGSREEEKGPKVTARHLLAAYVRLQSRVQLSLSPGNWIPFVRMPHKWNEMWLVRDRTPAECVKAIVKATEELCEKGGKWVYEVVDAEEESGRLVICCYTRARWMDVITINFSKVVSGSNASVSHYSSGFLPLIVPLAPILNCVLCFIPFYDGQLAARRWLPTLRKGLTCDVQLLKAARVA